MYILIVYVIVILSFLLFLRFVSLSPESTQSNPDLLITSCPESITVNTDSDREVIMWEVPTTNQEDLTAEYSSHSPGTSFPIGITRVTYIFYDDTRRNSATCSFLVTVVGKFVYSEYPSRELLETP